MRIILYIVGGFLVVVALFVMVAAIGGSFMCPTHRAERSAHFNASPETIYALISNFAAAAEWRSDLERVEMLAPRDSNMVWREFNKDHNNWAFEAVELSPPNRIKVAIAEPDAPVEGTWTISIDAEGTGSLVTVVEEGSINNVIFRFLGRLFYDQSASIRTWLNDLASRFGESISLQ
jgi:uncharacterized protein YndB with AHSA1/START domain